VFDHPILVPIFRNSSEMCVWTGRIRYFRPIVTGPSRSSGTRDGTHSLELRPKQVPPRPATAGDIASVRDEAREVAATTSPGTTRGDDGHSIGLRDRTEKWG